MVKDEKVSRWLITKSIVHVRDSLKNRISVKHAEIPFRLMGAGIDDWSMGE